MERHMKHIASVSGTRCQDCPVPIRRGDIIVRMSLGKFRHLDCPTETPNG